MADPLLCYFDIAMDGEEVGRIVMRPRVDVVPRQLAGGATACLGANGVNGVAAVAVIDCLQ